MTKKTIKEPEFVILDEDFYLPEGTLWLFHGYPMLDLRPVYQLVAEAHGIAGRYLLRYFGKLDCQFGSFAKLGPLNLVERRTWERRSKYRGVMRFNSREASNYWRGRIVGPDKREVRLDRVETEEEAARDYNMALVLFYGSAFAQHLNPILPAGEEQLEHDTNLYQAWEKAAHQLVSSQPHQYHSMLHPEDLRRASYTRSRVSRKAFYIPKSKETKALEALEAKKRAAKAKKRAAKAKNPGVEAKKRVSKLVSKHDFKREIIIDVPKESLTGGNSESKFWIYREAVAMVDARPVSFVVAEMLGVKGRYVEHINGNPYDCRKCNLRFGREPKINERSSHSQFRGVATRYVGKKRHQPYVMLPNGNRMKLKSCRLDHDAAIAWNYAFTYFFSEFPFYRDNLNYVHPLRIYNAPETRDELIEVWHKQTLRDICHEVSVPVVVEPDSGPPPDMTPQQRGKTGPKPGQLRVKREEELAKLEADVKKHPWRKEFDEVGGRIKQLRKRLGRDTVTSPTRRIRLKPGNEWWRKVFSNETWYYDPERDPPIKRKSPYKKET